MNDWVNDITEAEGSASDDDEETSSLFEDNFRRMVRDEEVEGLNATTIENQIGEISDPELLADAIATDDREECIEVYRDRVGELNAGSETSEDGDEAEPSDDTEKTPDDQPTEAVADDDGDDTDGTETNDTGEMDGPATEGSKTDQVDADRGDGESDESGDVTDLVEDTASTVEDEPAPSEDPTSSDEAEGAASGSDDGLPEVNVAALAPAAIDRDAAAESEKARTMLVWGPEGTGKSHVSHTAPAPICYIDTEGKADELAAKFDKRIHYWTPENYDEATTALDEALAVLSEYFEAGHRGTLVVDSMGVMWEWAQVHHMALTRPSAEGLHDVQFESAFGQGSGDWQEIKGYHNTAFRDRILDSPYHVVLTAGRTEKYDFDGESMDTRFKPDGEKHNKYAVKEVVRLQTNAEGKTVANLRKAAQTRYSFVGLEWPEWDTVYDAIDMLVEAETSTESVDVSDWPFEVVEGQPVHDTSEGSDDGEGGDD